MTTKIFLSGTRDIHPVSGVAFAAGIIAQLAAEAALQGEVLEFSTGDNEGFEACALAVLQSLSMGVLVVPTGKNEDGHRAWDTRHEVVGSFADRVVYVHPDPLSSNVAQSALKVLGDKVTLAGHEV